MSLFDGNITKSWRNVIGSTSGLKVNDLKTSMKNTKPLDEGYIEVYIEGEEKPYKALAVGTTMTGGLIFYAEK